MILQGWRSGGIVQGGRKAYISVGLEKDWGALFPHPDASEHHFSRKLSEIEITLKHDLKASCS